MKILFVVYDNGSYDHTFPMGFGAIGGVLIKEGHEIEVWNQDMHHYPDDNLRIHLDNNHYDAVFISLIAGYYQYRKMINLSKAINTSKDRPIYIMGGYGPTPEPEFFLEKSECDIICLGEGEVTVIKLIEALERNDSLTTVPGIAWKDIDGTFHTTDRPPQVEDLDSLPWYPYELFPMYYYRMLQLPRSENTDFCMPMMSARGCTFKCTFCYRMDPGYRKRNPEALLNEVEFLYKTYGITRITFQDDLLMSSVAHTVEVCNEFIKRKLPVTWDCNGRLNYCSPELLHLMKQAGCVFINYGIESMDQNVLNSMKKGLSPKMIIKGIEDTLDEGISPGFNFIFGCIGDNRETLKKSVEFLLKYDDFSQKRTIRPVTPYPGSPLYHTAIQMGLLNKDKPAEDFYEHKHLNSDLICSNFTEMSDDEFYDCLKWANKKLMKNFYDQQKFNTLEQIEYLYRTKDVTFRGFRHHGGAGEENIATKQVNWENSRVNDGDRFNHTEQEQSKKQVDGIERYVAKSPTYDQKNQTKILNMSKKSQAPSRIFQ
jgi:anaerobic magnesium-protoporphyrin IX monomethyl ester cyclase